MSRPKKLEEPTLVRFHAEARTVQQLDLIGRSSKAGRMDRSEMLRTALNSFISLQLADDAVRTFVEQNMVTPALRLHRRDHKSTNQG